MNSRVSRRIVVFAALIIGAAFYAQSKVPQGYLLQVNIGPQTLSFDFNP